MAGVAGSGLSGATGRLAPPLRGRWQARPLEQVLRGLQARGKTSRAAAQTAEEALSAGCMKGATVDWRCGIDDGLASRRTSPGSAHCCNDEGKEDDRRDDMQRASCSCDGAAVTERGGAVSGR